MAEEETLLASEAPLKRKLDDVTEAAGCKQLRDCHSGDVAAAERTSSAVESAQYDKANTEEIEEIDGNVAKNGELKRVAEDGGSATAGFEESEVVGEGEVLEEHGKEEKEDEAEEEEDDDEEELSEIDTEDDDAEEDAESEEDDSEESSDEEGEEERITSTSSSLQAASKGKGIDKGKGKEKEVVDIKGKGIMVVDKGKGKAKVEDDATAGSDGEHDEDDAGYLSEDPLDEVDLNNILPTRTRRHSSSTHYDFVDMGDDGDDDDDDSDA